MKVLAFFQICLGGVSDVVMRGNVVFCSSKTSPFLLYVSMSLNRVVPYGSRQRLSGSRWVRFCGQLNKWIVI